MIYLGQKDFDEAPKKEEGEQAQPTPLYIVKLSEEEALKHNKAMEQKHKVISLFSAVSEER